ncbi:MAG TPA: hypothetical protein VLV55_11590 [Rhizomicrobium sp.]|nr:hypothetical protein [Rhizomicrobium sp.]
MTTDGYDGGVKGRSGWLIPLGVFVVTAALSALFLLFYLAPAPTSFIEEHPAPTSRADPVTLTVGSTTFTIPANYLVFRSARQGGTLKEVALYAALPDLHGYSDWEGKTFTGNAADSPVVYMLIGEDKFHLGEAERFERIYLGYVTDPKGKPGPFALTQYTFREDSGYRGEDLFVGHLGRRMVVLRCDRPSPAVPSPSCLRDVRLPHHLSLSYRFKRTQLSRWDEIANGVENLVHGFTHK